MKMNKSSAPATFVIEQGMISPRDQTVGWRFWEEYPDLDAAKKTVRSFKGGIWRIIEMRELFTSHDEQAANLRLASG